MESMTSPHRLFDSPPHVLLSLSQKTWIFHDAPMDALQPLSSAFDVSELVARILHHRGYTLESAGTFLTPKLQSLLPDPFLLTDMDKGVNTTLLAMEHQHNIAVFADYDVDGATSSALIRRYFEEIGIHTELYIPNRLEEGYGPNIDAMNDLHARGIKLILMVDCGTLSFEPLQHAHDLGIDVVVLDHHLSEKTLPKASAVINPNRCDPLLGGGTTPLHSGFSGHAPTFLKDLCAAGVTFLFLVALHKTLREKGFFKDVLEPNLMTFLDLVALGTVCDVMPLTHLNRVFVTHGLRLLNHTPNKGLKALCDHGGCRPPLSSYHLGFVIGPRVNAGGRVGDAWMGSHLLTTHDPQKIQTYAHRLHTLNQERQTIEKVILDQAYDMIEKNKLYERPVLLVSHKEWHPGVIGIAASRLKDRYQKPSLVVSYMLDEEIGKGSGRSITGVSMGKAMHEAVKRNLLTQGGGHDMAAGFAVRRNHFDLFYDFLCDTMQEGVHKYTPTLSMSGFLSLSAFHPKLVHDLSILEPFGQGNPTPKFSIGPVMIRFCDIFGEDHLRLTLEDSVGNRAKAIHFRAKNTPYFDALQECGRRFYLAGTLKLDTWNGQENVTFHIEDVAEMSQAISFNFDTSYKK